MRARYANPTPERTRAGVRKVWSVTGATFAELAAAVSPNAANAKIITHQLSLKGNLNYQREWYGVTYAEAVADLRAGWTEGAKRALELARTLPTRTLPKRKRASHGIEGGDINLDRILIGHPAPFRTFPKVRPGVVPITVNVGGLYFRTSDEMFWSGATLIAVADSLTAAGYSVAITAVSYCQHFGHDDNQDAYCAIKIKDAHEPMRPAHMAAALCRPVALRIGAFQSRALCPNNIGHSFGATLETPKELQAPVHIPLLYSGESARAFLTQFAKERV